MVRIICKFQGFHTPNFIIRGINHINLIDVAPNVTIIDGDIGERRIWMKVRSQISYGIDSTFEFCGEIAEV